MMTMKKRIEFEIISTEVIVGVYMKYEIGSYLHVLTYEIHLQKEEEKEDEKRIIFIFPFN